MKTRVNWPHQIAKMYIFSLIVYFRQHVLIPNVLDVFWGFITFFLTLPYEQWPDQSIQVKNPDLFCCLNAVCWVDLCLSQIHWKCIANKTEKTVHNTIMHFPSLFFFLCYVAIFVFLCVIDYLKKKKERKTDIFILFILLSSAGHYMLIKAASNLNISSTARLISLPQPAGQVICVSFLYHIFGSSIGTYLTIISYTCWLNKIQK